MLPAGTGAYLLIILVANETNDLKWQKITLLN